MSKNKVQRRGPLGFGNQVDFVKCLTVVDGANEHVVGGSNLSDVVFGVD